MQNRSSLNDLFMGIAANLRMVTMDEYEEEPAVYKKMFNIDNIDTPFATDDGYSGAGLLEEKPEGEEGAIGSVSHMFPKVFTPVTYSLLLEFPGEAVADDRLKIIQKGFSSLGMSARATEDLLGADIFNTCFTAIGPDGKTLAATDHLLGSGLTTGNCPAVGMALSFSSVNIALTDWNTKQKTHNGRVIEFNPAYLWVPPALQATAGEILNSMDRPDTANRATNTIKDDYNLERVVWKKISDSGMWGLLSKKGRHHINAIVRQPFRIFEGTDDKKWTAWVRAQFRMVFGYSDWRGFYATSPSQ